MQQNKYLQPQIHNLYQVYRSMYEAIGVKNIDAVLPPPPPNAPKDPSLEHIDAIIRLTLYWTWHELSSKFSRWFCLEFTEILFHQHWATVFEKRDSRSHSKWRIQRGQREGNFPRVELSVFQRNQNPWHLLQIAFSWKWFFDTIKVVDNKNSPHSPLPPSLGAGLGKVGIIFPLHRLSWTSVNFTTLRYPRPAGPTEGVVSYRNDGSSGGNFASLVHERSWYAHVVVALLPSRWHSIK